MEEHKADRKNIISQATSPVKDLVTGYEKIINISLSSSSSQRQEHLVPPPTKKEMTRKVLELGKLFEGGMEPDLGTGRRDNLKPVKPPSKRKIWTRLKSGLFGWKVISTKNETAQTSASRSILNTHAKLPTNSAIMKSKKLEKPPPTTVGGV